MFIALAPARAQTQWQRVYEGIVDGVEGPVYPDAFQYPRPCLGDLDGDGDLDALVSEWGGPVWLFRNDGTPTNPKFSRTGQVILDLGSPSLCTFLVDIDADGDLDLFAADYGAAGGSLCFYRNIGSRLSPNFQSQPMPPDISMTVGIPTFADIDGDGDYDFFLGSASTSRPGGNTIFFYRNIGTPQTPSFHLESSQYAGLAWDGYNSIAPSFMDLDGDGNLDMVLCVTHLYQPDKPVNETFYYKNTGTRQVASWTLESDHFIPILPEANALRPTFGDLDGDGDMDCMIGTGAQGIFNFRNVGSRTAPRFENQSMGLRLLQFGTNNDPAFGDLDGDGDPDLVIGNEWGKMYYYRNQGSPGNPYWSSVPALALTVTPGYVPELGPALADIDGDGDLDLFVGGYGDNGADFPGGLHFFENTGTPTHPVFQTDTQFYNGIAAGYPSFVDIDGDGDLDMFIRAGSTITHYQNIGTQQHAQWSLVTTNYGGININSGYIRGNIAFSDIDGDGDYDLAYCKYGDGVYIVQNVGTPTNAQWSTWYTIPTGPYFSGGNRACSPAFADIDGDGDVDLFVGLDIGGLKFFRNTTAHLGIYPRMETVLTGSALDLQTVGVGTVTWRMTTNRSGGSIDSVSGHYVAGPTSGVIDVIEASDASGVRGLSHINVISMASRSAVGKAVVMAGTRGTSIDPLWPTTNNLAHYVYRTLLYRGFSRENIMYLNPQPAQDVDGNGNSGDDIDAASTFANMQTAMTTFAAGSPNLTVYLIDHGGADAGGNQGYIRCNENDVLGASQLGSWLDALQTDGGVTTVTLVLDCCQSGAFLKAVGAAPAGRSRVTIASAGALQPAFFSAGGLISFTDGLVGSLFSGYSFAQSFQMAAGAMDRYQQAQLDDNGNGLYEKDIDGALAGRLTLGVVAIAGADRPQIGKISPNQSLTSGSTQATIWASDISSVYPIERVWATIAAPDFIASSQADPTRPITELPQLELAWNAAQNRYEATTNTLTQAGVYSISIYARDIWGSLSLPKRSYINQSNLGEKMIIVCGDGTYDADSPWEFSNNVAQFVYETARARWLTPETVAYLSSSTDPGVDGAPSKTSLQSAIAAAGSNNLTVYLIGNGNASAFDIDGDGADADDVAPAELDGWLDALQSAGAARVTVILDFNQSGAWLAALQSPTGKQRIVIASCAAGESSWCEEEGMLCFSHWLFAKISGGINLRDAFNYARTAMRAISGEMQNPQMDDDGSGADDWLDGTLAKTTYLGAAFVIRNDPPVIDDCARNVVLTSNSELLWVSNVWDLDGIDEVFAYVIRPGSGPAGDRTDKVTLTYDSVHDRWQAAYANFDPSGRNVVIYYAKDRTGLLSEPCQTEFLPPNRDRYDCFYDDDTSATLNFFANDNASQVHNFWSSADEDWARFNVDPHRLYSINVTNQAATCDARIELYRPSDVFHPLLTRDDYGPGGPDEFISWDSGATSGTVLVRVRQSPRSAGLSVTETTYTLTISGDWGPNVGLAIISGTKLVVIGPDGGTLSLPSSPSTSAGVHLQSEDVYIYTKHQIYFPPGALDRTYIFLIESPNDLCVSPSLPYTQAWLAAHPGNASVVQILTEEPIQLLKPVELTVQFINNGPSFNDNFTIDDIPPGATPDQMRIQSWTGSQWIALPEPQSVSGDTVKTWISTLGTGVFASSAYANRTLSNARDWTAYE